VLFSFLRELQPLHFRVVIHRVYIQVLQVYSLYIQMYIYFTAKTYTTHSDVSLRIHVQIGENFVNEFSQQDIMGRRKDGLVNYCWEIRVHSLSFD
jgi:hypothetical protein